MASDPDHTWAERLLVFVLLAAMTVEPQARHAVPVALRCGGRKAEAGLNIEGAVRCAQVYLARLCFAFRRNGLVLRRGAKRTASVEAGRLPGSGTDSASEDERRPS